MQKMEQIGCLEGLITKEDSNNETGSFIPLNDNKERRAFPTREATSWLIPEITENGQRESTELFARYCQDKVCLIRSFILSVIG